MKEVFLIIFFTLVGLQFANGQKILALDKLGKQKRIRYYEGDIIKLKTNSGIKHYGELNRLSDSSFFVGSEKVKLADVKYIQNTKKHYGWNLLAKLSFTAATGYFLLDTGNRLINDDQPVVHEGTVVASSVMYGVFFISSTIANRKYRINKKRQLKIIDITI